METFSRYRPACRVVVGGRAIDTALTGSEGVLISLEVTDHAGGEADVLEFEIDDREGHAAPKKGDPVDLWLGYEPQPVYMGSFKVDEWAKEGPRRRLRVSAKAAEMTSDIRAPRLSSFDDTTVGEIVRQVAGRHSLEATVDSELDGVAIAHIDQQHESDLAFLARLAHRVGATFKVADGKALFARTAADTLPSGRPNTPLTLKPRNVSTWAATSQGRGSYKSVRAMYHDHATGRRKHATAGAGDPTHHDRKLYGSQMEAQAAADAHLAALTRGLLQMETEGPGLPEAFAGGLVKVTGFDPDVDGAYLAKTVHHSLTSAGFKTTISLTAKV